ncbi:MAG: hypothetical protein V1819_03000 [bacterium]
MIEISNENFLRELEATNKRRQAEENPPLLEISVFIVILYSACCHLIPWMWTLTR